MEGIDKRGILRKWVDLPENMQKDEIRKYYEILQRKRKSLFIKRLFDVVMACLLLVVLSPAFLILAIAIRIDSKGSVFYRQVRVTQYGRKFRIHKFRSMVNRADEKGSLVTVKGDGRITRVGRLIRDKRLDEIPQLIDVLQGNMSFVGVRPEVPKYVMEYTPEMMATLLLPAGITNLTSIYYKDESELLEGVDDSEQVYIKQILPEKMKWNLKGIEEFGLCQEMRIMILTVFSMFKRNSNDTTQEK